MGMDWTLGVAFGSCLLVQTSVGIPAYESLQVPVVVDEIGCYFGLLVLADGELQMTYVVAMGYNAIIVVVVGLVVAFPMVPSLLLKSLLALVSSFPE